MQFQAFLFHHFQETSIVIHKHIYLLYMTSTNSGECKGQHTAIPSINNSHGSSLPVSLPHPHGGVSASPNAVVLPPPAVVAWAAVMTPWTHGKVQLDWVPSPPDFLDHSVSSCHHLCKQNPNT